MAKTTNKQKLTKKPQTTAATTSTATTTVSNTKQKTLKKPNLKKRKKKQKPLPSSTTTTTNPTDSDSDSDLDLSTLLEPYTKDQLIDLISEVAIKTPSLYSLISTYADRDVTHRKIFVHGLSPDTTRTHLLSAFEPFGEIEDCNVVADKLTGKAKGYGFVTFKTRKEAKKALKDPKKFVHDRIVSSQLASLGPPGNAPAAAAANDRDRKIYVSNMQVGVDKERLREYFSKFGEIESGPTGFDKETGRSRGFAFFVYKNIEGVKRVLEEPYKMFDGQLLHCSRAADRKTINNNNNNNNNNPVMVMQGKQQPQQQQLPQPQVLAAVAAASNLAMFGQHLGLNPAYSALFGNVAATGGGVDGGMISPVMAGPMSQGVVPTSQVRAIGVGSQSLLRAYTAGQGLQHVYMNGTSQIGQAGMGRGPGMGGSFPGYPSYMWEWETNHS